MSYQDGWLTTICEHGNYVTNCQKCAPTPSPIDTTGQEKRKTYTKNGYFICRCGVVAMPLTDDTSCDCADLYEQEWNFVEVPPTLKAVTDPCNMTDSQYEEYIYGQSAPASIATTQGDEIEQAYRVGRTVGRILAEAEPKPAPQAEAQNSFEEWFTDERADKYQYGAEGPARDAWNAQQAKIDALERSQTDYALALRDSRRKVQDVQSHADLQTVRALEAESRISELEEKLREGK